MYSFYGGKQGRTYHIVKTYASIADMTADFADGGQCTDVMYHEYVLIDTSNTSLNDPENGRLYRRGFDYNAEGESKPTFTAADYNGTELKETAKQALYKYIHNPGAGAIYVGCIRGSDGPGMSLKNPATTQHSATPSSATNLITVTSTLDEKLGEHSTYSLTFDFPIPTFATPAVNTIVPTVGEEYNASITIEPQKNAPFYINSTFDVPQGLKGNSITSVSYGGSAGNRTINFYATTQSKGEEDKIIETQDLLGTVSYYGLERLGVNSSNMHLMATYTQPSMNSDTQNPSTVEDLGELSYGIVSQNTVYRMTIGGNIYPLPGLPKTFQQGDKPIILQTLNTSVDSTNSTDVIGTFLLGYDTNTTHTSQFDPNHTLSESNWYKMQEISGVTADPGKIITAGVMSSSTKYGDETVQYSDNIKPNIDLLAPGGFILNAYDTEIHEFGTDRDTHPTVGEFQEATADARQGQWTNGSPSASEYYAKRRRYVYYV